MCFQKGVHLRHGTAPGLSVKKKRVGSEEEKERGQGEIATIRERLPKQALACSNERKSICMIHARESVPKGVGGGRAGRSCEGKEGWREEER